MMLDWIQDWVQASQSIVSMTLRTGVHQKGPAYGRDNDPEALITRSVSMTHLYQSRDCDKYESAVIYKETSRHVRVESPAFVSL